MTFNGSRQKLEVTRTAHDNKEFHRIITGHDIVKVEAVIFEVSNVENG